jgi:two-component system sensor histidine kinase KdpD
MDTPTVSRSSQALLRDRALLQSLIAWACIGFLTYCGFVLQVKPVTIGSLYLLVVVAVASLWGLRQASLTSILAVACLDYFFMPPIFRFDVTDSQDWAALAAFEVTALVISRLSAREVMSAEEASFHRVGMEKLYELSRNSLLLDLHQPPGSQLVVLIHRIFGVSAVALFDNNLGRQDRIGDWGADEQNLAQECWLQNAGRDDPQSQTSYRIVQDASGSLGALVIRGKLNELVVNALASLTAIAFDRHRAFEKEEQADVSRRSEQLRAAVMDSLGHELKTPLTTVQTASSGLLELGGLNDSQFELVKLIDDETLRLNKLCTRLLLTAKLESKQVGRQESEVNVRDLLAEVLTSPPADEVRDRIEIAVDDAARVVRVDRGLLTLALAQYIDNARKYSAPGTPIRINARISHSEILLSVQNIGSIVRIEERERIFDRFYRALNSVDSVPGTGIGLSVVKKAAEAHHGHVWVISDEKEGTTFFLSVPVSGGEKH